MSADITIIRSSVEVRKRSRKRIVCIAAESNDITSTINIPPGDILIYLGNPAFYVDTIDVIFLDSLLAQMNHLHKIVIGGRSDTVYLRDYIGSSSGLSDAIVLNGNFTIINNIKIYCATKLHADGSAGVYVCKNGIEDYYPEGYVDVILSAIPPYGIMDKNADNEHIGSRELLKLVENMHPTLCLFSGPYSGLKKIGGVCYVSTEVNSDFCMDPITIDIY